MTYSQEAKSYRDPSGQWVQCGYCDDRDPNLRHPIEYVLSGEANLWWQSPSLAQGLQYHAVTITMDFRQVSIWFKNNFEIKLLTFRSYYPS